MKKLEWRGFYVRLSPNPGFGIYFGRKWRLRVTKFHGIQLMQEIRKGYWVARRQGIFLRRRK